MRSNGGVFNGCASLYLSAMALCLAVCGCDRSGAAARLETQNQVKTQDSRETGKETGIVKEHKSGSWSPALSDAEKEALFAIARDTLKWSVEGPKGRFSFDGYELTPRLKEKCATFVTFKNKGRLRGCIGYLEAIEPMYISVQRSAANASRDSRFVYDPIRLSEVPEIDIHVSLLSPRREIGSYEEFKIGEHGICLEKRGRHAVFLPEVAPEQNWTREETLSNLSMKAGLDTNAWREGCTFRVFESVVLSQ